MKKYGVRWYLFLSAVILLCASCLMSLAFCTAVSKQVMYESAYEMHIDDLKQIDHTMDQIYFSGKRRLESIGNDTAIRNILDAINKSEEHIELHTNMKVLDSNIRSSLFGAREFISFYVVTQKGVLSIDELWTDAEVVFHDWEEENIYEAVQNNYEKFIHTKSAPQQRIFQPIGEEACLIGILDYREAWQDNNNIIISQQDGVVLYQNITEESIEKAREIISYQSSGAERILKKAVTPHDLAPEWKKLLRISLVLSFFVIAASGWGLYVYSGKISKPILQFGKLVSLCSGADEKEARRAYKETFQNSLSLQAMVFRFYAFTLLPVMGLIFLHTRIYQQDLYQVLCERKINQMELVHRNVNEELDEYLNLARFLSFSTEIRDEILRLNKMNSNLGYQNNLSHLLMSKGILGKNITNIAFYGEDFSVLYRSAENIRDIELPLQELKEHFKLKKVQTWWEFPDKRENICTMIWRVRYLPDRSAQTRSFRPIGYIRFDIRDLLSQSLELTGDYSVLYYNIVDETGQYLIKNANKKGLELTVSRRLSNTSWNLELYLDKNRLFWESVSSFRFNLFILAVSVMGILLACLLLTKQIRKPVLFLQNGILHDDMKTLTAIHKTSTINEFAMLAGSFEEMLERMEDMNQELIRNRIEQIEVEKRTKEAELTAMQMQISPHFIYNIFSSIQFLLMANNIEQASKMIKGVGEFMRAGIYRSSQNVTLETEVKHAEAYINLQALRYGSKLIYLFEMQEELGSIQIPRFIIQPLLENSIEHGFAKKRPLKISLSIKEIEKGMVEILVTDNGIGITEDVKRELEQTVRQCKQNEHIGLVNVYERLQLYFGRESTFEIESIPDQRTHVRLTFKKR